MRPLARTPLQWGWLIALGMVLGLPSAALAQEPELAGSIGFELRGFPYTSVAGDPSRGTISVVLRPELTWEWDRGDQRLTFVPFFRLDQTDDARTHFDIRELVWIKRGDTYELTVGIGHVFWGVTESQHLVDIINQTDLVENPDGEDKLGQPMVNLTLLRDWGAIDIFVLPGFRERTFPGEKGRFRPPVPIDTDRALYEAGARNNHVDFAVRWSHFIGDWDIGVAQFHGTGREPTFVPASAAELLESGAADLEDIIGAEPGDEPGGLTFVPFYSIIDQTSVDLTGAKGDWLWKVEVINRFGQGDRYLAATGGFEYTLVGAFGSVWDVGLLAEYLWDERGDDALTIFEDDIFIGTRLGLNDVQSTQILAGVIVDRQTGASMINVEASRRLGERYVAELEARFFVGAPPTDPSFIFQGDDYIQLEISRYF